MITGFLIVTVYVESEKLFHIFLLLFVDCGDLLIDWKPEFVQGSSFGGVCVLENSL
jgi:hypothetical protein